jgi:3-oxoacyl-[acyl-carrier protein] reductase
MNIKGKTAVITGASRGIGRAICLKLAEAGANIVINYSSNTDEAMITKQICEQAGAQAIIVKGNVADFAACEKLFSVATEAFVTVDILVNNAGITRDNLLLRMSSDDFRAVLDVNLTGAFNCLKLASAMMIKKRYGRIVNISSIVGLSGNAGQANYAASKAGLIGLTKSAAKELARRNITVNAIAPGFIETDMTAELPEEIKAAMKSTIPMARIGKAEEVADAVLFFCADSSAYLTGQVLCVDGGMAL